MEEIRIQTLRDSQKSKLEKAAGFMEQKPPVAPEQSAGPRRIPAKVAKSLGATIFVFLVGGLGGLWLDRVLLPNLLVEFPTLERYSFLKQMNERTTVINETKQVLISQEEDIASLVEKAGTTIAEVRLKNAAGDYAKTGSGIILTSDGYVLSPLGNIMTDKGVSKDIQLMLKNGKTYAAEVKAQDTDHSLAILKLDENNLSVTPYADSSQLKLGTKLIVVNDSIAVGIVSRFIDDHKAAGSTDSSFQKRILIGGQLDDSLAGSAVIDLEGKLAGVFEGGQLVIPLDEIKSFIEKGTVNR